MPFAGEKNNLYVVNHSESFIFFSLKGLVLPLLIMLINFTNVLTMNIPWAIRAQLNVSN